MIYERIEGISNCTEHLTNGDGDHWGVVREMTPQPRGSRQLPVSRLSSFLSPLPRPEIQYPLLYPLHRISEDSSFLITDEPILIVSTVQCFFKAFWGPVSHLLSKK